MIRPFSKFVGKYRTLKPRGYTFQYLYGANYRCYHKHFRSDSIWIWVKGNDVEICDFHSKSGWVVSCIVKNRDKLPELMEDNCFSIRMNTKTGKIRHYNMAERRFAWRTEERLYKRKSKAALELYYDKWKKAHLNRELVEEILALYDDGLIELQEIDNEQEAA